MKKVSKIMSALLALVMCLSLLPMSAFAKNIEDYNAEYGEDIKKPHEPEAPVENDAEFIAGKLEDKLNQEVIEDGEKAAEALDSATNDAINKDSVTGSDDVTDAKNVANAADQFLKDIGGADVDVTEQANTIDQAAGAAGDARQDTEDAYANAQEAVANRDQAALSAAKSEAQTAYDQANTAAATAEQTYEEASTAVQEAQDAYDAAVEALKAAGYDEETIEAKLTDAKTAVEAAQEALAKAETAKNEAVKQRDYAELYVKMAEVLSTEYDLSAPDNVDELTDEQILALGQERVKVITEAMNLLDKLSKQYGEMDAKELQVAAEILIGSGEAFDDTWYLYQRIDSEDLWIEYQSALQTAREKEAKHKITDGEQEDILYKVLKMAISKQISDGSSVGDGLNKDLKAKIKGIETGINQYWKAEEFLKNFEGDEPKDASFSYQDDNGAQITVEFTANEAGGQVTRTVDGNAETYTPDSPEWSYITALIRAEMANQLDAAYQEIYLKVNSEGQTLYAQVCKANEKNLEHWIESNVNSQLDLLTGYLSVLEYELGYRSRELRYQAGKAAFETSVAGSSLVETMLSGVKLGMEELNPQIEQEIANQVEREIANGTIPEDQAEQYKQLLRQAYQLEYAGTAAYYITELQKMEKDPGGEDIGVRGLWYLMQALPAGREQAAEAQAKLDQAVEDYNAAQKAAEEAQAKLAELTAMNSENQTKFAQEVAAAKAKLEAANLALGAAQAKVTAAQTAQQEAQAAYEETMRLAIAAIPGNGGNGIFDFGDLTTIDDEAVPLASGPVTRAEFIDYLWRHEGEPASDGVCTFTDVAADHEFILALAWAEQNGLVEANEDGTFEPDELVTVAAVRDILDNFADVFGTNAVAADDLTTLTGEEDEAVLNCDEVLAEFFGEEYTPAEAEDDIAA